MEPRLLISVVRRGRAEKVVSLVRREGASGSTVLYGRGTAPNKWLCLLCLADVEKELVFTVASRTTMGRIEHALRQAPDLCVKTPGLGIVLDVSEFSHLGPLEDRSRVESAKKGNMGMECDKSYGNALICVIVNSGLADDLMQAARDAGATGGTILRARGTGRDEDNSFFGITIVPEKELLMILSSAEQQKKITAAIEACESLSQPGVGVIFTLPVEKFFPLGLKANGGWK